jgi:hypothetical protein
MHRHMELTAGTRGLPAKRSDHVCESISVIKRQTGEQPQTACDRTVSHETVAMQRRRYNRSLWYRARPAVLDAASSAGHDGEPWVLLPEG